MNEIRRFLRFTLPGLACVLELAVACEFTGVLSSADLSTKDLAAGLGMALSGFLASGALGYLFAILYFALY